MELTTKADAQAMANKHGAPAHHVYVVDAYCGVSGMCEEECLTTDASEANAWAKQWKNEYDKESGFKVVRKIYNPNN